ncbi:MAG: phage antirepressor KilAC domain-containing protein, partial [Vagococcus sp.]
MELIPVKENHNGQVVVSGRELHEFLEIATKYEDWFPRMIEYGFDELRDFHALKIENVVRGRVYFKTDHALTISMAKEISMIQRNEKGKQARQYFIKVEEAWNSPEMIMKRALQIADKKIISLEEKIQADKPKTIFADAVAASHTSILVGELAKMLKQNGVDMGANRLFQWLRTNGFLIKRKGTDWNMPTQYSMDLKLFEIKETNVQ